MNNFGINEPFSKLVFFYDFHFYDIFKILNEKKYTYYRIIYLKPKWEFFENFWTTIQGDEKILRLSRLNRCSCTFIYCNVQKKIS